MALLAGTAFCQNDAGLVWYGLTPGTAVSGAVHNTARTYTTVASTSNSIIISGGVATSTLTTGGAFINLGTNFYNDVLAGSSELTLSVWVKSTNIAAIFALFGNVFSAGSNTGNINAAILAHNRVQFYVQTHSATNYIGYDKSLTTTLTNKLWNHLVFIWAGHSGRTNLGLVVNGIGQTTTLIRSGAGANITNLAPCNSHFRIASFANSANPYIANTRVMTKVGIYNRALKTNEVQDLYIRELATLPPP